VTKLTADGATTALAHGRELFNAGEFWEAHEAWEPAWLAAREPDRTFFQGLIQAAAALVHWQRHNPRGLRANWFKARPKLLALDPAYQGYDLARLIRDLDALIHDTSQAAPKIHLR
jgi:uncharacterized protein